MRLTGPKLLVFNLWILGGCGMILFLAQRGSGPLVFVGAFFLGWGFSAAATWLILLAHQFVCCPFPPCHTGKCFKRGHYAWVSGTLFGWLQRGTYIYKCNCGKLYVRRGRRFMEACPDGSTRGYLKIVGFRNWVVDVETEEERFDSNTTTSENR